MQSEEWKEIAGWPYEVSTLGRIRRGKGKRGWLILKQTVDAAGYHKIGLRRNGERQKIFYVHILVAEAFLTGERPVKAEVNHKDLRKWNNAASNLEWTNRAGNARHASESGAMRRGESHPKAKLTAEDVLRMRREYAGAKGEQVRMAEQYGVSQVLVSRILRGHHWTHLPEVDGPCTALRHKSYRPRILTPAQVERARQRYASGEASMTALAKEMAVSVATVSNLIHSQ